MTTETSETPNTETQTETQTQSSSGTQTETQETSTILGGAQSTSETRTDTTASETTTPEKTDAPNWAALVASLPKDQQDFLAARGHDKHTLEELIGGYQAAHRFTGMDKAELVRRPRESREDDPQGWAAFDKAMGVPEDGKYGEYAPPEGVPNNVPDEVLTKLDAFLHQQGGAAATPETRTAVLNFYNTLAQEESAKAETAYKTQVEQGLTELKTKWGDQYEPRVKAAIQTLRQFDDKPAEGQKVGPLTQLLNETGLGDDPRMIAFMSRVAEATAEGGLDATGSPGSMTGMTPEAASKRIQQIEATEGFWAGLLPNHKDLVNERAELMKIAHGG